MKGLPQIQINTVKMPVPRLAISVEKMKNQQISHRYFGKKRKSVKLESATEKVFIAQIGFAWLSDGLGSFRLRSSVSVVFIIKLSNLQKLSRI